MIIQTLIPVGSKTTMRIGGQARYFAEVQTRKDIEDAYAFAKEKSVPLIVLGGGSNTVFADGIIEALVIRLKATETVWAEPCVTVQCGKILASLVNECAEHGLDLSALTGIPGTVGGAIFGNAGQGHGGIWIDSFVKEVTYFEEGEWHTVTPDQLSFAYRESAFKYRMHPVIVWEVRLEVPRGETSTIKAEIERLIKKRIETQPHLKTAGSCFKSLPDGTPAWKLIEAAGLRGHKEGDIQISEKHANFLLNTGKATFENIVSATRVVKQKVPQIAEIEMRLYGNDGRIVSI